MITHSLYGKGVSMSGSLRYEVRESPERPALSGSWDAGPWNRAATAEITYFREEGGTHRPKVRVKLLHYERALYASFLVEDRYVRCVHDKDQDPVFKDSCVEIFLDPPGVPGYFNVEMNCGATLLMYYITDPQRDSEGRFREALVIPAELLASIQRFSTLPKKVEPEITEPLTWRLSYKLSLSLLERVTGKQLPLQGSTWRGNFFKCGDDTSHPHWGSWAPIGEGPLNFHRPERFAEIVFL